MEIVSHLQAVLMVMPVADSMRKPRHASAVVVSGTVCYGIIAAAFGAIAYVYGYGGVCTHTFV